MAFSKFFDASLPLMTLMLAACSGSNNLTNMQDTGTPQSLRDNDIVLPIGVGRYSTWQCQDNTTIDTQFTDASKTVLQVKLQGKEYTLLHRASRLPVIYENTQLAFYSDGESAVIGKPLSDTVLHGGCKLR